MKRNSKQEEELEYESWRTQQCKFVIEENRKLREARYTKRQELDVSNAIFKEKHMLETMNDQMTREIETLATRDDNLRGYDQDAKKLRHINAETEMINAIFDIANEAFIHQ